jgi:hypothetical protein
MKQLPRPWREELARSMEQEVANVGSITQMANYVLLEWPDNPGISDSPPAQYVPKIRARFSDDAAWRAMHEAHALPEGWEQMDYAAFLDQRRRLMAAIIRRDFETLR